MFWECREMRDTNPETHIPGVLKALREQNLPHRVIAALSKESEYLTNWTEKAFPWECSQIDWTRVSSRRCVEWTSLEDLVPAFRKMADTLDPASLVVVMWANALCPVLEMLLGDVQKIATQIFEDHETSSDVFVFNTNEGWLIEMHHEGTLCLGRCTEFLGDSAMSKT
jgi:hypothetical protein